MLAVSLHPEPPDATRWATILGMVLVEAQQVRLLACLQSAGAQSVTLAQLRKAGIDFPAVVLSELEINGYQIDRVHQHGRPVGFRLAQPPNSSPSRGRH